LSFAKTPRELRCVSRQHITSRLERCKVARYINLALSAYRDRQALFNFTSHATLAGVNVLAENDAPSFVLVNAIFLLGTFTFAIVLGVVSDDIGNELKAIRSGNYPVLIKDHGDI
jgi:hypothetical protein